MNRGDIDGRRKTAESLMERKREMREVRIKSCREIVRNEKWKKEKRSMDKISILRKKKGNRFVCPR